MIDNARRSSPEQYLRQHYPNVAVNQRGDAIRVDGVLRADLKDGRWLSCDWAGGRIGDNIDLVRFVEADATFPDAVFILTGAQERRPIKISQDKPSAPSGLQDAAAWNQDELPKASDDPAFRS